ncbi:MAG: hypothetical protein ACLPKB_19810 [Xanthobacteraceae bacterium]
MAKRLNARRRFEELFSPVMKAFMKLAKRRTRGGKIPREDDERRRKLRDEVAKKLMEPVQTAFEKAGLDLDNEEHRLQMLIWLSYAVYGRARGGAPRQWTPERHQHLLRSVNELRARDPKLKETECCDLLSKGRGGGGQYKGRKGETLRRVLQRVKDLQEDAEVLTTPVQEVFASVDTEATKISDAGK